MGLHRHTATFQLQEIIPATDHFLGLDAGIERVASANEVGRHEDHGRVAELEQATTRPV
jgi:hypothetical protein